MQKVNFTVPSALVERVEKNIFGKFESLKKEALFFRKKNSDKGKNLIEFEVAVNYNHELFLLGKIFGEEISAAVMKEEWEKSQK